MKILTKIVLTRPYKSCKVTFSKETLKILKKNRIKCVRQEKSNYGHQNSIILVTIQLIFGRLLTNIETKNTSEIISLSILKTTMIQIDIANSSNSHYVNVGNSNNKNQHSSDKNYVIKIQNGGW